MSDLRRIISDKRDGIVLTPEQMTLIVEGVTSGDLSDVQTGAFLMAVYLNGLTVDERVALTLAMRDSGERMEWDLPGPVLDKHSTGGVGDTVSLILAPALAACGAYVPMISGKGLGHTGGTLDKLEAILGYMITPTQDVFRKTVGEVGCAIVGQSEHLAPADKRLYALRDESATVGSVDLVVASILSKKLAAGLDGLVLDVKTGPGALISDQHKARELAQALVDTSKMAGCATQAVLSDMSEPVASVAGNALEVKAALDLMSGQEIDDRLWDLTVALGGSLLEANALSPKGDGASQIADVLQSGAAIETFAKMVAALGGPKDLVENPNAHLSKAPIITEIYSAEEGFIEHIDTTQLGKIVVGLGGGRQRAGDRIDAAVGIDWIASRGTLVDQEQPIARVHSQTTDQAERASAQLRAAFLISQTPPDIPDLLQGWIT